jgi:hypothetical protein
MMTIKYILIFGFIFSLSACGQTIKNEQKKRNSIKKVTVAFSGFGCESECPFQVLSVDKDLKASYYGGQFAENYGYYKGQFSQSIWDSITTRFEKFYNKGIDTTEYFKTDHPNVEFYITDSLGIKYFKENTGKMADTDLRILYWFIKLSSQTKTLKPCDSLIFETTLQYPFYQKKN